MDENKVCQFWLIGHIFMCCFLLLCVETVCLWDRFRDGLSNFFFSFQGQNRALWLQNVCLFLPDATFQHVYEGNGRFLTKKWKRRFDVKLLLIHCLKAYDDWIQFYFLQHARPVIVHHNFDYGQFRAYSVQRGCRGCVMWCFFYNKMLMKLGCVGDEGIKM